MASSWAGEGQVGYQENLPRKSSKALAQAAQLEESPALEAFKSCGDATLRDMVSEHCRDRLTAGLDYRSLFQPQ